MKPPYPLGTRVKTGRGETGILDEVYTYDVARYCVKMDGDTNKTRRLIIEFEDVTPIDEATAA